MVPRQLHILEPTLLHSKQQQLLTYRLLQLASKAVAFDKRC